MNKVLAITNFQIPKEEFLRNITSAPSTQLRCIRSALFEEAITKGLTHPSDVLVKRKAFALRSLPSINANGIWSLMNSLTNNTIVPV